MPRWLAFSILAIGIWGIWGVVSAAASKALPAPMVQVLYTAGLLPVTLVLLVSPRLREARRFGRGMTAALATGLCGSMGNLALFESVRLGGEASAVYPLTGMYPLVTVILAALLLKERLNPVQGLGILLAAGAIYLMAGGTDPRELARGMSLAAPWMVYALRSLVLFGVVGVLQKVATNNISNELSTIGFAVGSVPVAAFIVFSSELDWAITPGDGLLAVLTGILMGIGTLVLFAAYRWGKASIVTPVTALYPALTAILAIPVFKESLSAGKLAAVLLALLAAAALSCEGKRKSS